MQNHANPMSNDEPTIPEARTTEARSPSALPDGDVAADTTIANSGNNEVASTVGAVGRAPGSRTVPPYIPFPIWTLPESVRKFVLAISDCNWLRRGVRCTSNAGGASPV